MDRTGLDKMKELYGIRAADDIVAIFQLYKIRKEKGWDRRTFVRESNIDICNYDNIERKLHLPDPRFKIYFDMITKAKELLELHDLDIHSIYALEIIDKTLDQSDKYKYKYEFFKEAGISSSYYTSFFPIARTSIRIKIKKIIEDKIQYENRYAELERRSLEDLVLI